MRERLYGNKKDKTEEEKVRKEKTLTNNSELNAKQMAKQ
jgi:hypothetical protein